MRPKQAKLSHPRRSGTKRIAFPTSQSYLAAQ